MVDSGRLLLENVSYSAQCLIRQWIHGYEVVGVSVWQQRLARTVQTMLAVLSRLFSCPLGVRQWWTCPSLVNDRSLFVDVGCALLVSTVDTCTAFAGGFMGRSRSVNGACEGVEGDPRHWGGEGVAGSREV